MPSELVNIISAFCVESPVCLLQHARTGPPRESIDDLFAEMSDKKKRKRDAEVNVFIARARVYEL